MCSKMKILFKKLYAQPNFIQNYISYRGPYLWNKIVISEKLTFSGSDSLQAFKGGLKRLL